MEPDVPPLEEPLAELERQLIDASVHAAAKLTEIECRSRFVNDLHDTRK